MTIDRVSGAVALLVIARLALGQQPNGTSASLKFNNFDNGSYPLALTVTAGPGLAMDVAGPAGRPYAVVEGALGTPGFPTPFGIVDIGTPPFFAPVNIIVNGAAPMTPLDFMAVIPASGTSHWTLPGLPATCGNPVGTFQAVVLQPTGPAYHLTAATTLIIGNPSTSLVLADDANTPVVLAAPFTYYGVAYTTVYVCSNGMLSFANDAQNNTYVPSQSSAETGPPRVLLPWQDLYPPGGGTITYALGCGGGITVNYTNIPCFVTGAPQTFTVALDSGNNVIWSAPVGGINNNATTNTFCLFGITKGLGSTLPSALINFPAVVTPGPGFTSTPGQAILQSFPNGAATVLGGHTVNFSPLANGIYVVY